MNVQLLYAKTEDFPELDYPEAELLEFFSHVLYINPNYWEYILHISLECPCQSCERWYATYLDDINKYHDEMSQKRKAQLLPCYFTAERFVWMGTWCLGLIALSNLFWQIVKR